VHPEILASSAAWNRFQYEELAESVRNPFWLVHHSIYDGISSNIGWYGLMAAYYKIFGFELAGAKVVRFLILAIALYLLLNTLRKFLSWRFC